MKPGRTTIVVLFVLLCSALAWNAQEANSGAAKSKAAKSNEKKSKKGWGAPPATEFAPQRVMLGWTGDPAHTQAVTWRTDKPADTPQVQFALASANPEFVSSAVTLPAKPASLDIGNGKSVSTYQANLQGLKPNTRYLYRVGDGKNWGEWNSLRTASDQPGKFRFIDVGDAQNDIKSQWSRLIRAAYAKAPKAAFIIHAGDLVASGYRDDFWGEWYDSMGFIAATIPSLPVAGNHELEKPAGTSKSMALPAIWRQQFTYPQNGPDVPDNESYYLDYQGVRLIASTCWKTRKTSRRIVPSWRNKSRGWARCSTTTRTAGRWSSSTRACIPWRINGTMSRCVKCFFPCMTGTVSIWCFRGTITFTLAARNWRVAKSLLRMPAGRFT